MEWRRLRFTSFGRGSWPRRAPITRFKLCLTKYFVTSSVRSWLKSARNAFYGVSNALQSDPIRLKCLAPTNGEREIELPDNVAKVLVAFIGDRKTGLLFQTRHGKPLSQSNMLCRHLHSALEEAGFEKSGAHAFRHYRNTFLRSTSCPLTLINYWLGWAGDSMSEHYDRSVLAAKFRKEVANRVGVGFDVPPVEPNCT